MGCSDSKPTEATEAEKEKRARMLRQFLRSLFLEEIGEDYKKMLKTLKQEKEISTKLACIKAFLELISTSDFFDEIFYIKEYYSICFCECNACETRFLPAGEIRRVWPHLVLCKSCTEKVKPDGLV
jgi:hypothetical protein